MAENEQTATARYIAGHVSTQLMLKTLFEIIARWPNQRQRATCARSVWMACARRSPLAT
jgi:hypothetical protein